MWTTSISLGTRFTSKKNDSGVGTEATKSLVIYKQDTNEVRKGYFVEVATTKELMAKGLMGRNKLDDDGFEIQTREERKKKQEKTLIHLSLFSFTSEWICRGQQ